MTLALLPSLIQGVEAPVDHMAQVLVEANETCLADARGHEAGPLDRRGENQHQAQRLEALGKLMGGVAHDLNNLLTIILGAAETLADEHGDDGDVRQLARLIREAGERGADLNDQLLAFLRRQPLEPASVDVEEIISRMDGLLRRALGEDVETVVAGTADLWRALVDAARLETAILNLAINARDAMPDGGRLVIETANVTLDGACAGEDCELAAGDFVLVAVTDTGAGMDAPTLERAFKPFFTTKAAGRGTGLGLSTVYGFAKQSGGHAKIHSELGRGTTVKLYLPRAAEDESRAPPRPIEGGLPGGREHVLVVEDDDLVRNHACKQLVSLGYIVSAAANGPEALTVLDGMERVDVLFTDVIMPGGMSGRQLADAVIERSPGVSVLYTSGYPENVIVHHGRLDPGAPLLTKPYRKRDLAVKVRAALDGGAPMAVSA